MCLCECVLAAVLLPIIITITFPSVIFYLSLSLTVIFCLPLGRWSRRLSTTPSIPSLTSTGAWSPFVGPSEGVVLELPFIIVEVKKYPYGRSFWVGSLLCQSCWSPALLDWGLLSRLFLPSQDSLAETRLLFLLNHLSFLFNISISFILYFISTLLF